MYCTRTGPGGQEGVYIWGILALELINSSHTTSPAIWWALDVRWWSVCSIGSEIGCLTQCADKY